MKMIVSILGFLVFTACAHNLNNEPVLIRPLSDLYPSQSASKTRMNCVVRTIKSNWGYENWNQILFQEDERNAFIITIKGGVVPLKFAMYHNLPGDILPVSFCEGDTIVLVDGLSGQTQKCTIVSIAKKSNN